MTVTHYASSKGPVLISGMVYTHLRNAADRLRREGDRDRADELAALDARLAELDAMPDDDARIEATGGARDKSGALSSPEGAPAGEGDPPAVRQPGDNRGPSLDTYEAIRAHIDDLYDEARNWLDGEPIATQAQADEVSRLRGMIREAETIAEKLRRRENEPFDAGKAEVQARYAELIADTKSVTGKTVRATAACRAALKPWLEEQDRQNRERARLAQEEADRKAAEAREAREATAANLGAAEAVDAMFDDAQAAQKTAAALAKERPLAGGGAYRATGLRDNWVARLSDPQAALRHFWATRREDLTALAQKLAERDVREGKRKIPGFDIVNERVAV